MRKTRRKMRSKPKTKKVRIVNRKRSTYGNNSTRAWKNAGQTRGIKASQVVGTAHTKTNFRYKYIE